MHGRGRCACVRACVCACVRVWPSVREDVGAEHMSLWRIGCACVCVHVCVCVRMWVHASSRVNCMIKIRFFYE